MPPKRRSQDIEGVESRALAQRKLEWEKLDMNELKWWCKQTNIGVKRSRAECIEGLSKGTLLVPAGMPPLGPPPDVEANEVQVRIEPQNQPNQVRQEEELSTLADQVKELGSLIRLSLTKRTPDMPVEDSNVPHSAIRTLDPLQRCICGHVLSNEEQWCPQCGSTVGKCHLCHKPLSREAKFCSSCGTRVGDHVHMHNNNNNNHSHNRRQDTKGNGNVELDVKGGVERALRECKFIDVGAMTTPNRTDGSTGSGKSAKCDSFAQWAAAWAKVIEIAQACGDGNVTELVAYSGLISTMASKFPWEFVSEYDSLVRWKKASVDPNLKLSEYHNESWCLAWSKVSTPMSSQHSQHSQHSQYQSAGKAKERKPVCIAFNSGSCNYRRCRFLHVCSRCNGEHTLKDCQHKSNSVHSRASVSGTGTSGKKDTA